MNKTAIIMSKEEAMSLPLKGRPICFRISSEMYHEVFERIGEASVCWKPDTGSAVFNSEQASDVAVRLCFKIADEVEKAKLDALREAAEIASRRAETSDVIQAIKTSIEIRDAILARVKELEK